ncbi:MAG: hypothetical protein HY238_03405 [Acidobacteria bacterium]|nr:hypothetical protein [Acidobacteriota bacterium]
MPAKVIPLGDLTKAVDAALIRVLGTGRPGGPIIVGRLVKTLAGNPTTTARKIAAEVTAAVPGIKVTPTVIPGKGGTTIGFILRSVIEQ